MHFRIVQSIESLDEIHSCLLRILMWNYQSKVNYLCVILRVHFRVFRKKLHAVVLAAFSGPSFRKYLEGFENSSLTRPSGGVFDVKLAKS